MKIFTLKTLIMSALLCVGLSARATDITYTFTTNSWGAKVGDTDADWTSGKAGNAMQDRGVQVTTGVSGANATSPTSFNDISEVVVTYSTNESKGAGTIKVQIGSNTEKSFTVSAPSSGGTTDKEATFAYSTTESGNVKLTVDCSTNSIYIKSVKVTYSSGSQPSTTSISIDLNDNFFGTSYGGSASGITDSNPVTGTSGNVTITYAGSGNHYINNSQIRFYPNNKLTFAVPDGYNITKIVFTAGSTWAATISANEGTYTSSKKTWEGKATSVLFTGSGSSRCDMSKATITLEEISTVAKPTCDPVAGEVVAGENVALILPDGADAIFYTEDGTDPTYDFETGHANGGQYDETEPIIISRATTIKAIAIYRETSSISGVATFSFTIIPPVAPTFTIGNNAVTANTTVDAGTVLTLSQTNGDADDIIYTTDGTTPALDNEKAERVAVSDGAEITITNTTTVKAIAVDSYNNCSAVASYTFTVNPPAAPTINFDESTSTVTITAAAGLTIKYTTGEGDPTTTYTAPIPVTETTTFKAIAVDAYGNQSTVTTKKVTIVNIEDGVFDFTLGTDYGSGISTVTDGYEASSSTWTAGNVTMVISGKYRWWNSDKTMRLYKVGNNDPEGTNPGALTISAPANNVITKVVFNSSFKFSVDKGNLSGATWTGMANSVTFTHDNTSSSFNITTITVTYRPVVANGNFGTICLPYGVDADGISGATFYTIASKTMDGENVTGINLEPVTTGLTAGVGYIYKATGTISLTPNNTTATDPVTGGAIVGTFANETEVPNGMYIVSGNKLCPTANDYGYINAYRAYIDLTNVPVSGSAAKVRISVQDDDATAITAIEAAEAVNNGVIYNLSGQRVVKPLKGIYIQNGKKFIVK